MALLATVISRTGRVVSCLAGHPGRSPSLCRLSLQPNQINTARRESIGIE